MNKDLAIQVPRCVTETANRPTPDLYLLVLIQPCCFCRICFSHSRSESPRLGLTDAMHKAMEQEVSVLSSSKQGLVYLTPNDWTLVADKASRVNFRKGDALVQKGKKSEGSIFF